MIQAKSNFIPCLLLIFLAGAKKENREWLCPSCTRERPSNFIFHSLLRGVCTPTLFLKALDTHFLETTRWKTRRRSCFSGKHRQLWHYSMGFESSSVHSPFIMLIFFFTANGEYHRQNLKNYAHVCVFFSSPPHFVYPLSKAFNCV